MSHTEFVDCGDFRDHLFAYQDGELTEGERQRFDAHLEGCQACQGRLGVEDAFLRGLRAKLAPQPAPAALKARILRDLENEAPAKSGWFRWFIHPATLSLATAALLAVVFFGVLDSGNLSNPGAQDAEQLTGVPLERVAMLVDLECDQMGATPEQQQDCLDRLHKNAFKLADGQYLKVNAQALDEDAQKMLAEPRRRGDRFEIVGRVAEAGIIRVRSIRPLQNAL